MTPITETLRRLAEKATPGARKVEGATLVWSPDARTTICACSAIPPRSRHVEYEKPELAELDVPAANARFIARCDPQTILAMCDAVDAAKRLRDAQERIRKPKRRADLEDACNAANDARRDLDTALEALAKVEG